MELLDYEKKHMDYLRQNAGECSLFLKRNGEFPLESPCSLVLIGNGARNTIKGGTGSGDVSSRFFKSIEDALASDGFTITSSAWLDAYDEFKKSTKKEYIRDTKAKAKKAHIWSAVYSMGFFEEEKDYDISCDYDGDACVYVLARNSGEGNDRRNIKGDVKLSDREVRDILYLNKKFKKFMLVLNVGGVVDLSTVMEVSNILLLSQLGVVTGEVFSDILLGRTNPCGKLTTTWAKPEDYPFFEEFGDRDDTYYKEGIYVGYRYFNTVNAPLLFPFGYGLSYTDFDISVCDVSLSGNEMKVKCIVKNTGEYSGKEVVQAYVSKPVVTLDNPYTELCNYVKTDLLKPGQEQEITLVIDFSKLTSYDEKRAYTILQKGTYVIRIGNSSVNLKPVARCILSEEIVVEKLRNKCRDESLSDFTAEVNDEVLENVPKFMLNLSLETRMVEYGNDEYIDPLIEKLSDKELAYMCLGHYSGGIATMVGSSCKHVVGGAGETVLRIPEIKEHLTMADGPAGLRLKREYGVDERGVYDVVMDPLVERMVDFLPKPAAMFIRPPKNRHGTIHHQYTTAIPIGTAIAQSFNDRFAFDCGELVAEEMKMFGVDLWLAPALNIHRNILCGRNFEYYSEDPYVSGRTASMMTRGVQQTNGLGVTIKHFACNNQEFNRNNSNSHVSERALREIYLKGFEICIKDANPKAVMTSYNLINGTHTSESHELINDILRCEWNYDGLIMTDWIASGRRFCSKSKYPAPYASKNILAGNDLTMSGCPKDYKDILKALKQGRLKRQDLVYSASRIYRSIIRQKKNESFV